MTTDDKQILNDDVDEDNYTENLPARVSDKINPLSINEFTTIETNATDEEIQKSDLAMANTMLKAAHATWGQVRTISGVTKMIDSTIKLIKLRRDVLNKPYGYQSKNGDGGTFTVDD